MRKLSGAGGQMMVHNAYPAEKRVPASQNGCEIRRKFSLGQIQWFWGVLKE
jgi:hypothetical protein